MNSIAGDTDCQKVNCPEGAREATLGCVASLLAMTTELRYPAEPIVEIFPNFFSLRNTLVIFASYNGNKKRRDSHEYREG